MVSALTPSSLPSSSKYANPPSKCTQLHGFITKLIRCCLDLKYLSGCRKAN